MRTGCDRDVLFCNIDTDTEALGVDIGEVMLGLFGIFVGHIEADMVDRMDLHLVIDRPSDDVTRRKTETRIVFLHKLLAVGQTQDTSVPTHGFGDEVGWMGLGGVEEARRMELHKLHVLDQSLGAIDHGDAVSGCDLGVGGGGIDSTRSAGSHERDAAEVGVYLLGLGVEDIRTVTLDIGGTSGDAYTQMVLRDDLHGKMVLQHLDMRVAAHRCHQSALDLRTGVIGMVQDTELRVTAFAVQIELTVLFAVEVHTPLDQFLDAFGGVAYHLFNGGRVTEPVTGDHRIVDMFLKIVHQEVRHRGDTSLGFGGVSFLEGGLAAQGYLVLA